MGNHVRKNTHTHDFVRFTLVLRTGSKFTNTVPRTLSLKRQSGGAPKTPSSKQNTNYWVRTDGIPRPTLRQSRSLPALHSRSVQRTQEALLALVVWQGVHLVLGYCCIMDLYLGQTSYPSEASHFMSISIRPKNGGPKSIRFSTAEYVSWVLGDSCHGKGPFRLLPDINARDCRVSDMILVVAFHLLSGSQLANLCTKLFALTCANTRKHRHFTYISNFNRFLTHVTFAWRDREGCRALSVCRKLAPNTVCPTLVRALTGPFSSLATRSISARYRGYFQHFPYPNCLPWLEAFFEDLGCSKWITNKSNCISSLFHFWSNSFAWDILLPRLAKKNLRSYANSGRPRFVKSGMARTWSFSGHRFLHVVPR